MTPGDIQALATGIRDDLKATNAELAAIRAELAKTMPKAEFETRHRRQIWVQAAFFLFGTVVLAIVLWTLALANRIESSRIFTSTTICERSNAQSQVVASVLTDARSRLPAITPNTPPEDAERIRASQRFYDDNIAKFEPAPCGQVVKRANATNAIGRNLFS